jgi:hypothetical protein
MLLSVLSNYVWMQMSVHLRFFSLQLPTAVTTFLDYLQFFSINIDSLRPECQLPISFTTEFFLIELLPLALIVIIFLIYAFFYIQKRKELADEKVKIVKVNSPKPSRHRFGE